MSSLRPRFGGRQWATFPNVITLTRLMLVLPIAIFIVRDTHSVLTVVLLIIFGASDWVDGYLARRLGQTSRVGAMLDPIADRVGVGVIAGALVFAGHLHTGVIVAIAAADVALLLAYLVSHNSYVPEVSLLGKARTAVLMTGIATTSLSLLPALEALTSVGSTLCGVGAGLHVAANIGYMRDIAHCSRDRKASSTLD